MKQFLISIIYFFISILYADGPGTSTIFDPALNNGIGGIQYTAYNTQKNQFIFTWTTAITSEISCVIFNTDGNQITSQKVVDGGTSSSPSVCYNSVENQYLVTWIAGTTVLRFAILNDVGDIIIGPESIAVAPDSIMNADAICCYNSLENQYCVTWTAYNTMSTTSSTYFVILNSDGTLAKSYTEIPNITGQTTGDFLDSFVSFNSTDNNYLFTWPTKTSGPNDTVFAIYNADGTVKVPTTVINQDPLLTTISHPIFSCYNSKDNQYFICWVTAGSGPLRAYFVIYDNLGNEIVSPTEITSPSGVFIAPVCSYNVQNNQYFVSWNDSYTKALCSIFDAQGNVIAAEIDIPLLTEDGTRSFIFNSFSVEDDLFFITWYANDNIRAFYNIFTVTPPTPPTPNPPSNLTGWKKLNRFANYGECFIELNWDLSDSPNIESYKIYRGNILIATLSASKDLYVAHNQPCTPTTYYVQAVNKSGKSSSKISITL